jgi:hypothetical protein
MLRRSELPLLSELPAIDDDPALFDPSPEWFVPGLKPALREDEEEDGNDGLGFRSLLDQPEALSTAWRSTGGARLRSGRRVRRARRRPASRVPGSRDAA